MSKVNDAVIVSATIDVSMVDIINKLSRSIHADMAEVGWWDDPERCLVSCVQLISTEIAEATEGARKDIMDDHLTHRKMVEVELADALIRLLDLGGKGTLTYTGIRSLDDTTYVISPDYPIIKQLYLINRLIFKFGDLLFTSDISDRDRLSYHYTDVINAILTVADQEGYNIYLTMLEKMDYNRKRADHKRENRAAAGGKKF